MTNKKDVLTGFFMQDEETIEMAKQLSILIDDYAEMRASLYQDTEEGIELYNELIEILKRVLNGSQGL